MITGRIAAIVSLTVALAMAGLFAGLDALIRFAEPTHLFAGVVPVALVTTWLAYAAWRRRAWDRFGHVDAVRRMATRLNLRAEVARMTCVAVGATLLVIAAARPQWGERTREVTREGIDVVFAVDLSRSMLAMDLAPSRLQAAVHEIDRLMRVLDGDRVGLVVFAADAVKQSPLTSDYGAIRHYLTRVHPDHFSRQGTAIGRAIRASQDLLTGGGDDTFERASNQLVVVISDGEDRVTDPVAASRAAAEAGIRVYTVGMGTPDGARIPEHHADGSFRRWLTDRDDQVVVSQLMENQLEQIAEVGGGDYRRYTTEGSVSTFVEQSIEAWDAEALSSALRIEYQERFGLFLVPGLLLLLIGTAIPRTRRHRRDIAALTALCAAALGGCTADQLPTRVDPNVAEAIAQAGAGEIEAARAAIERAGGDATEAAGFDYAAGWVEEQGEAWLDARDRYLAAIGAQAVPDQVRALFALGNVLLHEERFREAIERYQRALTLDPTHEGARRNLEIALRRLYPPCSALDDDLEDDDEAASATLVPGEFFEGTFTPPGAEPTPEGVPSPEKVACGGDADWWRIPALGGAVVDIEATFTRLRDDNGGPPLPETIAPPMVRIALYGPDGVTPIAVDQGLTEAADPVEAHRVVRRIEAAEVDPGLGPETDLYLEIEVDQPLEYEVELSITMTPPCYALEDEFEANDLASTARTLDNGEHQARACPDNADWYRFDLNAGDRLFVDVGGLQRDDGTPGTLDAAWYVDDETTPQVQTTLAPNGPGLALDLAADDGPRTAWLRLQSATEDDAGGYGFEVWHYPPCPDGNDRFEPNDIADERAQVGGQDAPPPFRHLRLCDGDVDWFEVGLPPMPEPEEGEPEPTSRPFSVLLRPDTPGQDIYAVVYDPTTGRPVTATHNDLLIREDGVPMRAPQTSDTGLDDPPAAGDAPTQPEPDGPDEGDGAPTDEAPIEPVIGAANLPLELESVIVVVTGDTGFYDLELPDTQQQEEQQQEQQDGEDGEDGEEGEESEDSESNADGSDESEADESEAEDGEDPSDEEQDANAPDDGEADDDTPEDVAAEAEAEERRAELLELLDALEDDDVNLQIQQALQGLPPEEFAEPW